MHLSIAIVYLYSKISINHDENIKSLSLDLIITNSSSIKIIPHTFLPLFIRIKNDISKKKFPTISILRFSRRVLR